jgi:hypothetical protein
MQIPFGLSLIGRENNGNGTKEILGLKETAY